MLKKILSYIGFNNISEDEEVVRKIEETFNHVYGLFPEKDLHFYLIETYLQTLLGSGMISNTNDEAIQSNAFAKTKILAQLPKEDAGRMLGIFMLSEFDPIGYEKNLNLKNEFSEKISPYIN